MERGPHSRRQFIANAVQRSLEFTGAATIGAALASCTTRRVETRPQPTPETMGGIWVQPTPPNGATIIKPQLELAAEAYPAHQGDPQIASVQFTAYWPGAPSPDPEHNPGGWPILATVTQHDADNVYRVTVDLQHVKVGEDLLAVPPGPLTISFDERNAEGNMKKAPNGEHHLIYTPTNS